MSQKSWIVRIQQNMPYVVGVALIIGIHWGWWKIQQNPALVDPRHRKDLPIYTMYKSLKARYIGEDEVKANNNSEDKELLTD